MNEHEVRGRRQERDRRRSGSSIDLIDFVHGRIRRYATPAPYLHAHRARIVGMQRFPGDSNESPDGNSRTTESTASGIGLPDASRRYALICFGSVMFAFSGCWAVRYMIRLPTISEVTERYDPLHARAEANRTRRVSQVAQRVPRQCWRPASACRLDQHVNHTFK